MTLDSQSKAANNTVVMKVEARRVRTMVAAYFSARGLMNIFPDA